METTYLNNFAELERLIRKNQTFVIYDIIEARAEQYRKVLDNGEEIYLQSIGDRSEKLSTLRNHLWSKLLLLNDLISDIFDNIK